MRFNELSLTSHQHLVLVSLSAPIGVCSPVTVSVHRIGESIGIDDDGHRLHMEDCRENGMAAEWRRLLTWTETER